jgi:hypothetical protein
MLSEDPARTQGNDFQKKGNPKVLPSIFMKF